MRGFSKAIITGNLTRDPELRTTPSGASVCGFTVAVNRTYRDSNGESREEVSFIDCSAWSKAGEIISQYAKKGTGILVSGRLDQHSWEDKTTGQKRSRTEIVVEDFNFLSSIDRGGEGSPKANFGAAAVASEMSSADEVVPDDIPEEEINLDEVPF